MYFVLRLFSTPCHKNDSHKKTCIYIIF